ncbi:MAG: response regulator [Pseudomonadota bacterium]
MMERTLLLVDDEENILAALVRLLRRDGYRILKANSGREGLELLAQNEVGVIVSDQRMPEMSGVQFLSKVKELYPDTVRIVLSGYTDLSSVTDAINRGAIYKFLTKPWDDELLRANVEKAFRQFEMVRENERLSREIQAANAELSRINQELEQRVEENTRQAMHNLNILRVSQEILESLPIAVIGVGEDGSMAFANAKANALFGGADGTPLVGCNAADRLPQPMLVAIESVLAHGDNSTMTHAMPDGRSMDVWCHRLGQASQAKGAVLVVAPHADITI